MKTPLAFSLLLTLSLISASADPISSKATVTTSSSKIPVFTTSTPSTNAYNQLSPTSIEPDRRRNADGSFKPHFGGVFVDGARYGAQLINPAAPAKYGNGEKYATASMDTPLVNSPDAPGGLKAESRISGDKRESGGIKLFTIEF